MRILLAFAALSQILSGSINAQPDRPAAEKPVVVEQPGGGRISYWLESSLKRVFPATPPGSAAPEIIVARNGRASFQACVRNDRVRPLDIECTVSGGDDLRPRVRWVGIVP